MSDPVLDHIGIWQNPIEFLMTELIQNSSEVNAVGSSVGHDRFWQSNSMGEKASILLLKQSLVKFMTFDVRLLDLDSANDCSLIYMHRASFCVLSFGTEWRWLHNINKYARRKASFSHFSRTSSYFDVFWRNHCRSRWQFCRESETLSKSSDSWRFNTALSWSEIWSKDEYHTLKKKLP